MTTTTVVRAGRGPAHVARTGWARGVLEVREFFRQRESVVFTLAFPVIFLLIFGSILNFPIQGGLKFTQYFAPGIMAVGLFGASFQNLAIQIAVERDKGILKRLEGTPMPPAAYFVGKVLMVLVMVVLEIVILLAIFERGQEERPPASHVERAPNPEPSGRPGSGGGAAD